MEPVPMPQVLEADRVRFTDSDDASTADLAGHVARLQDELDRTCAYGRDLWQVLGVVREYLVASLPDQPDDDGQRVRTSTAPSGPQDDEGWERWTTLYAAVTSSLAGARGDSGFGSEEAKVIAQHRRV